MAAAGNDMNSEKFSAEITYSPLFNLTLQQNIASVVQELKLSNKAERDLENVSCIISSAPDFVVEKTFVIQKIKAGEELALHDLNIGLNYDLLSNLSESVKGKLKLQVLEGEETIFQSEHEFEAFAPDQWLGMEMMPELLASFVTPNLEAVVFLQGSVARELERATGSGSLGAYTSDKKDVYETCAAIYRAIHNWGIQYAYPASSFGTAGQKIRFADMIYQNKLGTCLDTALLFASVMEACCLHPVIILQKGHAYVGCHLVERYFPDIPMDDLQRIRKLADLDEFLVIETTMVTGKATFAEAEAKARRDYLNIDSEFDCAIDIVRARYGGIRPLPLKRSVNGVELEPVRRDVEKQAAEEARKLEPEIDLSQLDNRKNQPGRVLRWSQKLLDLTLRNRLLNVRDTKLVIPIACTNIALLEDKISDNEFLSLGSLPNLLGEKEQNDLNMLRNSDVKTEVKTLLENELAQHRLWTMLSKNEMSRRLTALYRQGKTDLEEGGVNTIYLALGFVEWKVAEKDEKSYLSPILLLPVRLQRKSIVEGIKISRLDGETIVNETLLELLRSQYHLSVPGLSPLPADDSGVDVARVMQIFRQAIKDMKGWEVREEARVGHFSFGKFVMWHDMTSRLEVLKQTPLIDHLISGSALYDDGIQLFPQDEVGHHLDYSKLYCPVSADSSQLTAVLYSEMGKSFVLHGPPGTGKSQTITNIIAHNLALGKRVLFVSEKKAALDVVHKRLCAIGLKPFCLELHSNKSGKADVLSQFNEALQTAETRTPAEWEETVKALTRLRCELDVHVKELHNQYPNGFSAYDCFVRLLDRKKLSELPKIVTGQDLLNQSAAEYKESRQTFYDLAEALQLVSPENVRGLRIIDPQQWNPLMQNNLLAAAKALQNAVAELLEKFAAVAVNFSLQNLHKENDIYHALLMAEILKESVDIPGAFFCEEFPDKVEFISQFAENACCLAELQKKLQHYRLEMFVNLDFDGISKRIEENEGSFVLVKFFKNKTLLKELAGLKKSGGPKLSMTELKQLLPEAQEYVERLKNYEAGKQKAAEMLGKQWDEERTRWDLLQPEINNVKAIFKEVHCIVRSNRKLKQAVLTSLQTLAPDITNLCAQDAPLCQSINDLRKAWDRFAEIKQEFARYSQQAAKEEDLHVLLKESGNVISCIAELRNVLRYRNLRLEFESGGWMELVEMMENSDGSWNWIETYELLFFKNMLDQILSTSPALCQFSGSSQNERVRKFGELDTKYMAVTKKLIFAKLASNLPRRRSGPCPEGTELGMLKRECEKRARLKPVRQLLEQIPDLVPILKPCFLMSPLSVAQYLPAESAPFDLIVFDEASQIPVWDAIGVIARGKQLIVVGDPKQMPPTNFFQKGEGDNDVDESGEVETEDLESILDECIVAGVHSTYLNWHYRSRHESLIAFSNHHYYDDRLFTFPAAKNSEKLGIRFEFVSDGVYDRRNSRTNRKEAEALVRYVFDRLESSGGNYRSIGIVTFSQAQKDLIEDLLEKERANHPALESYFSDSVEEPLFVKNLENVQGDERDVILFSIGYASDSSGKFSMNFGPLNRNGGERRLNVAITRAKEQVVVFSSIHANQIELNRTNAVGAAHLKYFLDYAEKKTGIYSAASVESSSDGLKETIAEFLIRKGYRVERNVGCSGGRIDLAVCHPENETEFLLGIECDDGAYAARKTVRDRDVLRHQVLENLGWNFYRAWCVDWALDRARAEKELLAHIEKVRNGAAGKQQKKEIPDKNVSMETEEALQGPAEPPVPAVAANCREYQVWTPQKKLSQEDFYLPAKRRLIRNQITAIIEKEAPIYESLLKYRLVRAWGINRMGENVHNVLEHCLPANAETTRYGEGVVYWAKDQTPAEYSWYRVAAGAENKRSLDEIPPEEIANAMHEVLIDFRSCEKDTLFRETVKLFGFTVVTAKARKFLEYGFQILQKRGRI